MTTELVPDGQDEMLHGWLETAVRGLCDVARARIVSELREHIIDAIEQGVQDGLTMQEARKSALEDLGDPNRAREIFVREHLTRREAAIVARQGVPRPRPVMGHAGIRLVVFALASWLLAMLCMAEYATFADGVGPLSGREGVLIAPWVLWLGYCVAMQLNRCNGRPVAAKYELRRSILGFYALMWSSSVASLASTDGRILVAGVLWLVLVTAFSISRLPLAAKLHRVNTREVEAYYRRPAVDA